MSRYDDLYREVLKRDSDRRERYGRLEQAGVNLRLALLNELGTVQECLPPAELLIKNEEVLNGNDVTLWTKQVVAVVKQKVVFFLNDGVAGVVGLEYLLRENKGDVIVEVENSEYLIWKSGIFDQKLVRDAANHLLVKLLKQMNTCNIEL